MVLSTALNSTEVDYAAAVEKFQWKTESTKVSIHICYM